MGAVRRVAAHELRKYDAIAGKQCNGRRAPQKNIASVEIGGQRKRQSFGFRITRSLAPLRCHWVSHLGQRHRQQQLFNTRAAASHCFRSLVSTRAQRLAAITRTTCGAMVGEYRSVGAICVNC